MKRAKPSARPRLIRWQRQEPGWHTSRGGRWSITFHEGIGWGVYDALRLHPEDKSMSSYPIILRGGWAPVALHQSLRTAKLWAARQP